MLDEINPPMCRRENVKSVMFFTWVKESNNEKNLVDINYFAS